jgi:hypothetical protein
MGEELREDEREIFSKLTGREREPLQRVDQFAAVIGRRGGKSKAMATVATYIAGPKAVSLDDGLGTQLPERRSNRAQTNIVGGQQSSAVGSPALSRGGGAPC